MTTGSRAVEANARLTGTTGVVLLVLLAAEGLTVAAVGPLLAWHVAIGVALIPPVVVKMVATLWRFGHYYLGDPSYRLAGPPVPVLRAVGPVVFTATAVLLASGVAWWLAGPSSPSANLLGLLHRGSFVVWFVVMTVHVLAHTGRAGRLAASDLVRRPGTLAVPGGRTREGLVVAALLLGAVLGLASTAVATGWTGFVNGH